jgi:hypothetical protein
MDGLDDQAQTALASIVGQLYTHETVQVKHSSRDLIILGVTEALKNPSSTIKAKKLILRSGISLTAIGWLEQSLLKTYGDHKIKELEFCSLQDFGVLQKVFECCRNCGITKLTLRSFLSYQRKRHEMVSEAIRSGLITNHTNGKIDRFIFSEHLDQLRTLNNSSPINISCLEYLEIDNYPIGVIGTQILSTAPVCTVGLRVLKLLDCDIRSDSANYLAQIIRLSPKLQTLDLSYNQQFRSKLTREMTIKTIVERGLKDNLSLLYLRLNGVDNDIDISKLNKHLDINRLMVNYNTKREYRQLFGIHPAIWSDLLARVSVKPAALYFFLQQNITTIFS